MTRHSIPWDPMQQLPPLDDDVWELYGPDDWTQAHDLAAENPEMLAHLQRLFLIEAGKYNVLPLDDRRVERFNADLAGRPQLIQGNTQTLFGGMGRLTENSVVVMKNKSYAVTAEIVVPEGGASGTIVSMGGAFGGWSVYATKAGRLIATTCSGCSTSRSTGTSRCRPGSTRSGSSSPTTAGAWARVGRHPLRGRRSGRRGPGRCHRADGVLRRRDHRRRHRHRNTGHRRPDPRRSTSPVGCDWVQIDLGDDAEDADHLISPEERYRIAMARQ